MFRATGTEPSNQATGGGRISNRDDDAPAPVWASAVLAFDSMPYPQPETEDVTEETNLYDLWVGAEEDLDPTYAPEVRMPTDKELKDPFDVAGEYSIWYKNFGATIHSCPLIAVVYRCGHGYFEYVHSKYPHRACCTSENGLDELLSRTVLTKVKYSFCRRRKCQSTPIFRAACGIIHDTYWAVLNILAERLNNAKNKLAHPLANAYFTSRETEDALLQTERAARTKMNLALSNLAIVQSWRNKLPADDIFLAGNSTGLTSAFDVLFHCERETAQIVENFRLTVNVVRPGMAELESMVVNNIGQYQTAMGSTHPATGISLYDKHAKEEVPKPERRAEARALQALAHFERGTEMWWAVQILQMYPAELVGQWTALRGYQLGVRATQWLSARMYFQRAQSGFFRPAAPVTKHVPPLVFRTVPPTLASRNGIRMASLLELPRQQRLPASARTGLDQLRGMTTLGHPWRTIDPLIALPHPQIRDPSPLPGLGQSFGLPPRPTYRRGPQVGGNDGPDDEDDSDNGDDGNDHEPSGDASFSQDEPESGDETGENGENGKTRDDGGQHQGEEEKMPPVEPEPAQDDPSAPEKSSSSTKTVVYQPPIRTKPSGNLIGARANALTPPPPAPKYDPKKNTKHDTEALIKILDSKDWRQKSEEPSTLPEGSEPLKGSSLFSDYWHKVKRT